MRAYLLRRVLAAIPTLVGITVVTFLLLEVLPGRDIALAGRGEEGLPRAETVAKIREARRLDLPAWRRYLEWVLSLSRRDLGESLLDGRPVTRLLADSAGPTLALNTAALLFAFAVAIPLGVAWARKRGSAQDRAGGSLLLFLYAFPNFAAALLLQNLFAVHWGLLPLQGLPDIPEGSPLPFRIGALARHLILPAFCLAYGSLAYLARFTRANLLEAIGSQFLLAARGRGIREAALAWRHGMRNAAIPILTLVGFLIPALLAGSVLIETVFSWPGLGRLYFSSLQNRDDPVVLGLTTLIALLTLAGNLLADLLYCLADPRIGGEEAV